ncbi:hypothetical protein PHPALM_31224 [Phytophthora palmivora]|uniref:Uncharacterized protein n=1 Tax=Phytophthora palmivora TaxID=4796 RepID=A0A2P4X352_9STRA|nr:hypothetical protein PHPALM_31224 [Phytophthora palmivora]
MARSHLGVPSRMLSSLDVRTLTYTVEYMKREDAEAGLLGSECVERRKKAGVQVTRSPASSSLGEPELKRPQHLPPRPASIPSMRSLMSTAEALRSRVKCLELEAHRRCRVLDMDQRCSDRPLLAPKGPTSAATSDLPADQLRLTLQSLTGTKYAKEDETAKSEQTPWTKSSSVSRPKSQVRETKPVAPEMDLNRKASHQGGDPSGASSGDEASDEGYSSSDSSSSDEIPVYTTTAAMTQGGSAVTLRTFTNTL